MSRQTSTNAVLAEALRAAAPTLEPAEQALVVGLYRALSRGEPVAPRSLAAELAVEPELVEHALDTWPGVYRNQDGDVIGFWGLALSGMPHVFATEHAQIRAWCALDPFLIAPLLDGEQVTVRSEDPVTGGEVILTLDRDGLKEADPPTTVISMLRPEGSFDHDVVERFCHFVWFFASPESGHRWVAEHPGTFLLGVEEADQVARDSWPAMVRAALDTR